MTRAVMDDGPFLAGLHEALGEFELEAHRYHRQVGATIAEMARAFVHIRSGETFKSIGVTEGKDANGPYVEVGSGLTKALYEEFGTSKMRAQPFMRPAIAQAT